MSAPAPATNVVDTGGLNTTQVAIIGTVSVVVGMLLGIALCYGCMRCFLWINNRRARKNAARLADDKDDVELARPLPPAEPVPPPPPAAEYAAPETLAPSAAQPA